MTELILEAKIKNPNYMSSVFTFLKESGKKDEDPALKKKYTPCIIYFMDF